MRHVPDRAAPTASEMTVHILTNMRGIKPTPITQPIPWDSFNRMPGEYTTCLGMSENGCGIRMGNIVQSLSRTRRDLGQAHDECSRAGHCIFFGVAVGIPTPKVVHRQHA